MASFSPFRSSIGKRSVRESSDKSLCLGLPFVTVFQLQQPITRRNKQKRVVLRTCVENHQLLGYRWKTPISKFPIPRCAHLCGWNDTCTKHVYHLLSEPTFTISPQSVPLTEKILLWWAVMVYLLFLWHSWASRWKPEYRQEYMKDLDAESLGWR